MFKSLPILALLVSLPTLAQEAEETLESIKVSANKEGRTYAETPESVTILPPGRINRGDQSNSLEVLNGQANVQVGRNAETFSIRGINNQGVTGFQKDNLASVFVDDVFQTDLAMRAGAFEVWDMESLEVYRGPQSTSQGVNSLAGAIVLNHMVPHLETEAAVKGGYGSYNRRELGAYANKAFFNDKFALRLSFNKDVNDGFITNKTTGNSKWGRQDKGHGVIDMKYFFNDKSELRFLNKFLKTDNGGNYTINSNPFDYDVYEDKDYRNVTNNFQNSLQYIKPISDRVSNKTTLAFSKSDQWSKADADATPTNVLGVRDEKSNDQFISFENVLRYQNEKIKNALGIHAHTFRAFNQYDFTTLVTTIPVDVYQDTDKSRETYAIFDSMLYRLDSHHSLNLGARYEVVNYDFGTFIKTNPVVPGTNGAYDGDKKSQVLLPKIGWIYENAGHTYGLTYSQGYRIGGVDINRANAKAVPYDPEKTDNYEVSWKWGKGRIKTQANAFYTKWKDQQVEVRKSTSFYDTQVENISDSELYGAEVETIYDFKSGDNLRFGVGYVETHFLNFTNTATNGDRVSYTGNSFPDAAPWTAQTAFRHLFNDTISGNVTFRYIAESYQNAENTRETPEQYYTDLNLTYTGESFLWELNARNIFNQQYVLNETGTEGNFNYKRVNRPTELNTRLTWFF